MHRQALRLFFCFTILINNLNALHAMNSAMEEELAFLDSYSLSDIELPTIPNNPTPQTREKTYRDPECIFLADVINGLRINVLITLDMNPRLIYYQDHLGNTALHYAAKHGHTALVEDLLTLGALAQRQNNDGSTALHYVCFFKKNTEIALMLLKKNKNIINIQNKYGLTALHHACFNRNLPLATLLCDYKADPNLQEKYGKTALHFAAGRYNKEIVNLLLKNKADITIQDAGGKIPKDYFPSTLVQQIQNSRT